ncbi:MAG: hypothetical protein O3A46_16200 [Candidatus Poribacteria bacterium]|nr:hypothetical protein [Candidatus Poribacteria bacterium]
MNFKRLFIGIAWGMLAGMVVGGAFATALSLLAQPVVGLIQGKPLGEIIEGLPWAAVFGAQVSSITLPAGLIVGGVLGAMTRSVSPTRKAVFGAIIGFTMSVLAAPNIWAVEVNKTAVALGVASSVIASAMVAVWVGGRIDRRREREAGSNG